MPPAPPAPEYDVPPAPRRPPTRRHRYASRPPYDLPVEAGVSSSGPSTLDAIGRLEEELRRREQGPPSRPTRRPSPAAAARRDLGARPRSPGARPRLPEPVSAVHRPRRDDAAGQPPTRSAARRRSLPAARHLPLIRAASTRCPPADPFPPAAGHPTTGSRRRRRASSPRPSSSRPHSARLQPPRSRPRRRSVAADRGRRLRRAHCAPARCSAR